MSEEKLTQGVVIAIANQKGGTGKTMSGTALATIFAGWGLKVAFIDNDPQAHGSNQLGINLLAEEQKVKGTTSDLYEERAAPHEIAIETHCNGVFLIPSSPTLGEVEMNLPGWKRSDVRLRKAIEKSREHFDLFILDNPTNLGKLTINALVACDYYIIPVGGSWALSAVDTIVELAEENSEAYKNKNQLLGVFLTMTANTLIWKSLREEARSRYPQQLLKSEIRDSTIAEQAAAMQSPLPIYAPESTVSQDYVKLAEEIATVMKLKI